MEMVLLAPAASASADRGVTGTEFLGEQTSEPVEQPSEPVVLTPRQPDGPPHGPPPGFVEAPSSGRSSQRRPSLALVRSGAAN